MMIFAIFQLWATHALIVGSSRHAIFWSSELNNTYCLRIKGAILSHEVFYVMYNIAVLGTVD